MNHLPSFRRRFGTVLVPLISVLCVPAFLSAVTLRISAWTVFYLSAPLSVLAALAVAWSIGLWSDRAERKRYENLVVGVHRRRKGLIMTVGPGSALPLNGQPSLAEKALRFVQPEFVALVGSDKTADAVVRVSNLADQLFRRQQIPVVPTFRSFEVSSADLEPRGVAGVFDWLRDQGLGIADIVVDVTGGTVSMSLSTYIAAAARHCDVQVVRQDDGQMSMIRSS